MRAFLDLDKFLESETTLGLLGQRWVRFYLVFGSAHIRQEYLVDHLLFGSLVFAVELLKRVGNGGGLDLAAPDVVQEIFVDGLARARIQLVEPTGQAARLIGTLAV